MTLLKRLFPSVYLRTQVLHTCNLPHLQPAATDRGHRVSAWADCCHGDVIPNL